jgi:hypothetical protein
LRSTVGVLLSLAGLAAGRRDVQLFAPGQNDPVIRVGRLEPIGGGADLRSAGQWRKVTEIAPISTGDVVRTEATGGGRVDLAWVVMVLGPSSEFQLLPSRVLSGSLARGRLEQRASVVDVIPIATAEASVEGQGQFVVRRENGTSAVTVLSGDFRVKNKLGQVVVSAGQGTVVTAERAPEPSRPLPAVVVGLSPGRDPAYVVQGAPVRLQWTSSTPRNHLQILADPSGDVVVDRDVDGGTADAVLPLGLYRWHVSSVGPSGLEGLPSAVGWVCVVDR